MDTFFNFYTINLSHYEEREILFFVGPASYTQEEFNKLCKSLIPEATLLALANANNKNIEDYDNIISMICVINEIANLLKDKGFSQITPKTSEFWGSGSKIGRGDSPEMRNLINNVQYHNNNCLMEYHFDEESGDRE